MARWSPAAFGSLLPGGRPVTDAAARAEVEAVWGSPVPVAPGRDTAAILAAVAAGELDGVVVAGVDLDDLPDPAAAREALAAVPFLVSLEIRRSSVTELADVVFPVAPVAEKAGSFVNWEGRLRPFQRALETSALPDLRVLHLLAAEFGIALGVGDVGAAARELAELGRAGGWGRPGRGACRAARRPAHHDHGRTGGRRGATGYLAPARRRRPALQDGEPYLAGTARPAAAPAVRGHRGRDRRQSRRAGDGRDRGWVGDAAASDRPDA